MHELTIYHFMSDKLNLYSDIGNIIALRQRAKNVILKLMSLKSMKQKVLHLMIVIFSSLAVEVIENKHLLQKN